MPRGKFNIYDEFTRLGLNPRDFDGFSQKQQAILVTAFVDAHRSVRPQGQDQTNTDEQLKKLVRNLKAGSMDR